MSEVASAYLVATLFVGCVLVVALLIASAIRNRLGARGRLTLILFGTLLIGIAALERVGWPVHPWQPGSPAQHFDDLLFRILWLGGLGVLFVACWAAGMQQRQAPPRSASSRSEEEITAERKMPRLVK